MYRYAQYQGFDTSAISDFEELAVKNTEGKTITLLKYMNLSNGYIDAETTEVVFNFLDTN